MGGNPYLINKRPIWRKDKGPGHISLLGYKHPVDCAMKRGSLLGICIVQWVSVLTDILSLNMF